MEAFLSYLDGIPKPKLEGSMERRELENLLKSQPFCSSADVRGLDNRYCFYTAGEAKNFFEKVPVKNIKFRPEAFDCEDFVGVARAFEALYLRNTRLPGHTTAFGLVDGDLRIVDANKSNPHYMVVFVDSKRKVFLYEPQTNQFFPMEKLKAGSRIKEIRI